jgi:hypothetical protein
MLSNLAKVAVLVIALVLVAIMVGGVTPTAADAPQQRPPTVVLPTPAVTRTPPRVTPAAPARPVRAPATPTRVSKPAAPRSIPGPSGSFSSGFTIQNMTTTAASCSYQFFNADGSSAHTSSTFTVPASGSVFTYVPNISGLSSGQYAGVVSCDQQVAAVVNSASANSGGSYPAVASPATTWYAPNAFNNYYNWYTNFVVQNTTTAALPVALQVIDSAGTVVATQSPTGGTIPANGYWNVEQAGLAGLSANTPYSAKITATGGNIAVEANIFGGDGTTDANKLYSYRALTSGSTTAYAPLIMNNYYGYLTALTVQNIGTVATTVTVTYGTGLTQSQSILASSAYVFYTPSSGLPTGTLTSAQITSTGGQNIVALVNETNSYGRAASYTAFASGSTTVRAPIVLKRYYNYNTSITCQNVGTVATNMTITYSNGASSSQTGIAQNGTALFYQPNESGLTDGFNGSAVVTSSSQNIVCVVNEDMNEGSQATTVFDQLFAYEGF